MNGRPREDRSPDEWALERALTRFVDATLLHDDLAGARAAYADAQAHGLVEAGFAAELWAAVELRAAQSLPDNLDDERMADAVLRGLPRGVS